MRPARHGTVIDRLPSGGGPDGRLGLYLVRDEADGSRLAFDYTDIVTEGFRTIRTGERVRFHVSRQHPEVPEQGLPRAGFVVRLDQPDPAEYYR